MPRDLFGDVVDPGPRLGAHARSAVPMSLLGHAVFAAIVVIVPLMAADDRPAPRDPGTVIKVVHRSPPPPEIASASSANPASQPAVSATRAAPRDAPTEIAPASTTLTPSIGHPAGTTGGVDGGVIGTAINAPRLPEPPHVPPPARPVRPGGVIKTPVKVRHVPPIYPAIAHQARVEGIVIIEAIVGVDGRVTEARVLRSKPLLDDAALAAVRQWEFTPTTLNGVPVPVIMTVTVNFTLH